MNHFVEWLVPAIALLSAGLVAGFAAGIFGIGGGFVVVPALYVVLPLLGGTHETIAHVAIGTSAATIIFTSIRAVMAHAKRNAVDFAVLRAWAPWLVLGDGLGILFADRIDSAALTMTFAIGVLFMSLNFLVPKLGDRVISDEMPRGMLRVGIAGGLGAFSSLLGIGGGVVAITVMTLCGRSIHRAIATASGIGTLIAVPATIGFVLIGLGVPDRPFASLGYVNFPAMLAITSMSMLTAPLGVAVAHKVPAGSLRKVFGAYLVVIGFIMLNNALKM